MSNLSIAIVLVILIIIVILLIFVISLLKKEKPEEKIIVSNVEEHVSLPETYSLHLPIGIDKIGKNQLQDIVKKIFESYKYFDYQKMNMHELEKKEWHSWQISLILKLFKINEEFYISNQKSTFHSFLLNSSENDIKNLMRGIIKKYNNYVDINKSKDDLSKDYIWTNRDTSIIFYFLANYKKYSK